MGNENTIGQRIKAARKKCGMTQEQLANLIGIKRATISKYESGLIEPSVTQIRKLASWLGVDFYSLLGSKNSAIYDLGFKEGSDIEEWSNNLIDEAWKQEGYSYSDIECELINAFSSLNQSGQQEAVKRVSELTEIPRYQRQDAPQPPPDQQPGTDTPSQKKPPESP